MFTLAALGAKLDENFVEVFLPNYDPDREMTEDEISARVQNWVRQQQGR